jgi:tRNA threonylcarbamoyladenosine biosynthesis protein TsaE
MIDRRVDLPAMRKLAGDLARLLRPGDVICLRGDLGAGKTEFARALLHALGVGGEVPSPTFNLVLVYDTDAGAIWHFDLYRLEAPEEAYELGIEDAFADAVSLIEWPDRVEDLLPPDRLEVTITADPAGGENSRRITLSGRGDWARRLHGLADG